MITKQTANKKDFIMAFPKFDKLKQLYKENFLPEFVVQPPIDAVYKKYLHIPFFFLWVLCIVAILLQKLSGYVQNWTEVSWALVAHAELFWLTYFTPFVLAIVLPLKPFRNIASCLIIFYVYMMIASIFPAIGQWFAEHKIGHLLDLGIFLVSIYVGHFYIFRKLFFIKVKGKLHYIYTK